MLPGGAVLRALLPGRPTRDTLFADPLRDGTTLLKVGGLKGGGGGRGGRGARGTPQGGAALNPPSLGPVAH